MLEMKKISSTALALLLALSLAACGDDDHYEEDTASNSGGGTSDVSTPSNAVDDYEDEYEEEYEDEYEDEEGYEEGSAGFNVDFASVEPWIATGNVSVSTAQEILIWAMNEDGTYGMLSFVPASNPQSPVCVLGEMGFEVNPETGMGVGYMIDDTTGIEMAFAVEFYEDGSMKISGVFPIGAAFEAIGNDVSREEILPYVQDLCDNYTFVG